MDTISVSFPVNPRPDGGAPKIWQFVEGPLLAPETHPFREILASQKGSVQDGVE